MSIIVWGCFQILVLLESKARLCLLVIIISPMDDNYALSIHLGSAGIFVLNFGKLFSMFNT